jgi:predicted phage tail protein
MNVQINRYRGLSVSDPQLEKIALVKMTAEEIRAIANQIPGLIPEQNAGPQGHQAQVRQKHDWVLEQRQREQCVVDGRVDSCHDRR